MEFLVDIVFPFSILNILSHYFLTFVVTAEKLAVNLTEDPWHVMNSSLASFRILECFVFSQFGYNVSWFGSL